MPMPKIIENVREQLLCEARKQIAERGYAATTIRSVAGACGLGVGTVYNYFESKEMLIASFVYDDWKRYYAEMTEIPCDDPKVLLEGIHRLLKAFAKENEVLFSDEDAAKQSSVGLPNRHKMLRMQIATLVAPVCKHEGQNEFLSEFIAEALITWSMENVPFDSVYAILEKILK
jgi:AcrR family transcriptional regulator